MGRGGDNRDIDIKDVGREDGLFLEDEDPEGAE